MWNGAMRRPDDFYERNEHNHFTADALRCRLAIQLLS